LRGVNLNENEAPEDMVSLRLWVDEYRIISLRRRRLRAVVDIRESLEGGFGPQNSADFIARLTARLFERMEPTLSALDEKMDEIEETLLETLDSAYRKEITALRKQAIALRRYIAPQKDAMAQLRNMELDWLDQQSKYSIQESADRLLRYVEDLDALRERGQIIKEELAAGLSDQMNRNMYILSLVAAIFLPLGFLTGLLGINVGGMPGADEPLAFWIVCGVCVAFSILLAAIFRRLKWL
jgi:zinc transporter